MRITGPIHYAKCCALPFFVCLLYSFVKSQVFYEKGSKIRGKITKSSITFIESKPNLRKIEIGVSSFAKSKYEISPALRDKKQTQSNPIQSQFKANCPKTKNELKKCYKNELQTFCPDGVKKTKPNKPNWSEAQVLSVVEGSSNLSSNVVVGGPISSKAKMSVESLAETPGRTRKNLDFGLGLIFLLMIFNMPAKRQIFGFPQGGLPLTQLWVLR